MNNAKPFGWDGCNGVQDMSRPIDLADSALTKHMGMCYGPQPTFLHKWSYVIVL